jgi:isocitrate/isopropylmalate dehydrogenase
MLDCAKDIDTAVSEVLNELKDVTSVLGGSATTEKMGDAICDKLQTR